MNLDTQTVWQQFGKQLHQFIASRVDNKEDVEDILQSILVKIHKNIHTLDRPSALSAWVYQLSRNSITDYYRNRRKSEEFNEVSTLPDTTDESINNATELQSLAKCLTPFITQLKEDYKFAYEYTEIKGNSQVDLANYLGISISAAKSRVQRARKKLKEMFRDCCEIEIDRRGNILDFKPKTTNCNSC